VEAVWEEDVKLRGGGLGFVKEAGFKPGVKESLRSLVAAVDRRTNQQLTKGKTQSTSWDNYYWSAYNGPVLFCLLASGVVVVCRRLSGSVTLHGRPAGGFTRLQSNYSSTVTLHGGPVRLRPVRATSCYLSMLLR